MGVGGSVMKDTVDKVLCTCLPSSYHYQAQIWALRQTTSLHMCWPLCCARWVCRSSEQQAVPQLYHKPYQS
jgi:hypothetical protein